nr:hypothetical protein [Mycolicibacterium sp. CR10]
MEKVDDLLLARGDRIELPAHLGETLIDLCEPLVDVVAQVDEFLAEVDEVLAHGVKARCSGPAEIPDFAAELADVTIGSAGENPRGRGVALTALDPTSQIVNLILESLDTRLKISRLHEASLQVIVDRRAHLFQRSP